MKHWKQIKSCMDNAETPEQRSALDLEWQEIKAEIEALTERPEGIKI